MSQLSVNFDESIQRHFLAFALADTHFLSIIRPFLKMDHFTHEGVRTVMRATMSFYDEYFSAPDEGIKTYIKDMAEKNLFPAGMLDSTLDFCDSLLSLKLQNKDWLLDNYDKVLRHFAFAPAIQKAAELGERGEFDEALQVMQTAMMSTPRSKTNLGTGYKLDPTDRIFRRRTTESQIFYTLIPQMDNARLYIKRGEVGIIQGQKTGIGKSALLVFLARNLVFQRRKVIIYSMEMSEHDYEDRLDMAVSGLPSKRLNEANTIRERLLRMIRYDDMIYIKQFPSGTTTIQHLKEHTKLLRETKGFCPDVIMIDYDSLLDSGIPGLRADIHQTGHEIYSQLRGWMVEEQMGCWIASQSVKQAGATEKADVGDMGGSAAKAQIADLVFSINRNDQEAFNGQTRIFASKIRNAPSGFQFTIDSHLPTMQFWDSSRTYEMAKPEVRAIHDDLEDDYD